MRHFYGYEDYALYIFCVYGENDLTDFWGNFELLYPIDSAWVDSHSELNLPYDETPAILDTAKKIYIHPSCTLSRSLVRGKYKISKTCITADAVVLPEFSGKSEGRIYTTAAFKDDTTKRIVCFIPYYYNTNNALTLETFNKMQGTMSIKDMEDSGIINIPSYSHYNFSELSDARLFFKGQAVILKSIDTWIPDVCSGLIPVNKIISEKTLMKSLGSEDNDITFDSLRNICDMLSSTDSEIVGAGLKALAAMDYLNYSQSVLAVLAETRWNWCNLKECNTTTVKYMLTSLNLKGKNRKFSIWSRHSDTITTKDWELFRKIFCYLRNKNTLEEIEDIEIISFLYKDDKFIVRPRIATEDDNQ